MKNIVLALFIAIFLSGCASSGKDWSLYEPYEPVKYNKPLVNSMIDSSVAIVRTQAEGAVSTGVLKAITGILH